MCGAPEGSILRERSGRRLDGLGLVGMLQPMRHIGANDAKTHLRTLLDEVEAGEVAVVEA